jgi:hypothetical protein
MSGNNTSTRRGFLKGGAMVAAPLAMAPAAALADDGKAARLEDEAAIRRTQQDFLRQVSLAGGHERLDGAVRSIATDHAGEAEQIDITADGRRAGVRQAALVEIETALPRDTTLQQMAHAQGNGTLRHTERRVLVTAYSKTEAGWMLESVAFA